MLILNYHRVGFPPKEARYKGMFVTPQILAWHVKLLRMRGLKFTTISEGVRNGLPANACAMTFDDGYKDNLLEGFSVLKNLNVPATVYVVTGDVGRSQVVWQEAGDKVSSDLMSWKDLKFLESEGWEIGSHAADHVHLARRTREEQRALIAASWEHFETNLGHAPGSFAYPYGSFNHDTIEILDELRCEAAVTTESSGTNTALTPPLLLYRKPARGHAFRHALKSISLLWS